MENTQADFGFQSVPREEKQALVRSVFDRVADRYDLMNDLMSAGLHRHWKARMVEALRPKEGMEVLDLAGGTGDIAFRILKQQPDAEVTLCDINARMLEEGKKRAFDRNQFCRIHWTCGNAQSLPFPASRFDACTIAFGIRNVTDIPAALSEIHRVLKPGGKFLCLEFSTVENDTLRALYDRYSFSVIPRMGQIITGDTAPYQYLVESIRRFPAQKEFARMLEDAGFIQVSWENFAAGAVALHSGWKA